MALEAPTATPFLSSVELGLTGSAIDLNGAGRAEDESRAARGPTAKELFLYLPRSASAFEGGLPPAFSSLSSSDIHYNGHDVCSRIFRRYLEAYFCSHVVSRAFRQPHIAFSARERGLSNSRRDSSSAGEFCRATGQ